MLLCNMNINLSNKFWCYCIILGEDVKFPSQYPSGCLLGHVTVSDCLSQEDYQQIYPSGESESPYVFICKDPVVLPIRFPIKGQHKICEY